jgi:hypothetical protein
MVTVLFYQCSIEGYSIVTLSCGFRVFPVDLNFFMHGCLNTPSLSRGF